MSKTKKPKAFRLFVSYQNGDRMENRRCLVIPPGAPIPLPASVRRVIAAALKHSREWSIEAAYELKRACRAYDKHQAAEARKRSKT
jgi:hypothetical protein